VPASSHCDIEVVDAREVERRRDIGSTGAARDHCRPAIDRSVERTPRLVVLVVGSREDITRERSSKLAKRLVRRRRRVIVPGRSAGFAGAAL